MDATWLTEAIAFALPSGFLGAVVSWAVGRRKRNNDFLAEMQRSIDLLSERYNLVLQENIALRCEKADWRVLQQQLDMKIDRLTREVESLRRTLNLQSPNHDTRPSISNHHQPHVFRVGDHALGLVRGIPQPDTAQPTANPAGLHNNGDHA